jgi:hypothetical protein
MIIVTVHHHHSTICNQMALFFDTGHGYGRNYAVYQKRKCEKWKTPKESVTAAMAQGTMSGAKTKIMILNCCR